MHEYALQHTCAAILTAVQTCMAPHKRFVVPMAYIVMVSIVMTYIVMAYIVMAFVIMAYIAMA